MKSIWLNDVNISKRNALNTDLSTEIAVIGSGMAGILIAYYLQNSGHKVVLLEGNRIAGGETQCTTAKITSQHYFIYHKLINSFGEEKAKLYAKANQQSIDKFEELIDYLAIDCDFKRVPSYVYSNDLELIQHEYLACKTLDLPVEFCENINIPIANSGAVRFNNQAQFHPIKFISKVAENLEIYEQTPVLLFDSDNVLITPNVKVKAEKVVFATHYPFVNFPGVYFARMHQERSYVVALKNAIELDGYYIGADEDNSYSLRNVGDILLFGGEKHRTGKNPDGNRYSNLINKAKEIFPECQVVTTFSAQDCKTPDSIPFIGNYSKDKPNWYVATGFNKWGMTSSMVSAMIITDMVNNKYNSYAEIFTPSRFSVKDISGIACESSNAVAGLTKTFFTIADYNVDQLKKGQGGIVNIKGEKYGAYKDEEGNVFLVSPKCPHLGCQLKWNQDELSWDCPCHGSRFDYKGNLLSNPAQKNIKTKSV